jgi:predicted dehydrogenase
MGREPDQKLQVMIVGTGQIAGGYSQNNIEDAVLTHAHAYQRHGKFEVVACIDPDEEKRAAFQQTWNVQQGFSSLSEWITTNQHIDVISVCSPDQTHAAILNECLGLSPKLVFAEKPLALSLDDALAISNNYKSANVPLMVNYQRRWDTALQELQASIRSGEYGSLQTATAYYGKGLWHNGVHALDMLQWLFGPLEIEWAVPSLCGLPTYDARLRAETGAAVHMVGLDERAFTHFEFSLVMEKARIDIENSGFSMRIRSVQDDQVFAGYRKLSAGEISSGNLPLALAYAIDNIYDHIFANRPLLCDGHDACLSLKLANEIVTKSETEGKQDIV